jgi:SAM-dependent methyltransferase
VFAAGKKRSGLMLRSVREARIMEGSKRSMSGTRYYDSRLSGPRLREVYDIAPARVRRYLRAEVEFVLDRVPSAGRVLDLGCGYGRIIPELLEKAAFVAGIDNSPASLVYGRGFLAGRTGFALAAMDAARLGFVDSAFDAVVCIQNGVSAFKIPPRRLVQEALRVTRGGGIVLLSSYAAGFWPDRLDWFRLQAARGLVGEIDERRTRPGEIVCRDGFRAVTFGPDDFRELVRGLPVRAEVEEVDGSSLFCVLRP